MRCVVKLFPTVILALMLNSASADTINLTVTKTAVSYAGSSSNGFYLATKPDSSQIQSFGSPQVGDTNAILYFPQFILPAGAYVTNAAVNITFPASIQGTPFTPGIQERGLADIDNRTSVPGQIQATVSTDTSVANLMGFGFTSPNSPFPMTSCSANNPGTSIDLFQTGFGSCLVSPVQDYILNLYSITTITPTLVSAGFNSWEIFDFAAAGSVPITADLTITYASATPEPASLVLMATGFVGLGVVALRQRLLSRAWLAVSPHTIRA